MKEFTPKVTDRFLEAKEWIINTPLETGVRNDAQFAYSLGITRQVFTQLGNPKYGRNVTIEMCCGICNLYNVNGEWLLNGVGEMFRPKKAGAKAIKFPPKRKKAVAAKPVAKKAKAKTKSKVKAKSKKR